MSNLLFGGHTYTFAVLGLPKSKKYEHTFSTRDEAKALMYKIMGKYNLNMVDVWDDKHCKTYICDQGVRFFINRI